VEPGTVIVPFSAQTKQGREEIYEILDQVIADANPVTEEETQSV